jgi:hypothetical protein
MTYEKSVLVPLTADETFALITQPDRLRRWQVITARPPRVILSPHRARVRRSPR